MPHTLRLLLLITLACLAACAPATLSTNDAREAMKARMERSEAREVKVLEIHSFAISGCADADGQAGVVCQVQMDVGFTVDGAEQRDNATQRMRFVRESGRWVVYPML